MSRTVYTIGHSTHPTAQFVGLLGQHSVTAIGDVRSHPYSQFNPQFNREELKQTLQDAGISYVFLGKELGARSDDEECYEEDKVQYDRIAQTSLFQSGLDRVERGASQFRLALLCAEKDPLECHRTILVSRHLIERGTSIRHILADGTVETHANALTRLMRQLRLPEDNLFRSRESLESDAYEKQGERIAYRRTSSKETQSTASVKGSQ